MEISQSKKSIYFTGGFGLIDFAATTKTAAGNVGSGRPTEMYRIYYVIVTKGTVLPANVYLVLNGNNNIFIDLAKLALDQAAATIYDGNISGSDANSKVFYFPNGLVLGGIDAQLGVMHTAVGNCYIQIYGEMMT